MKIQHKIKSWLHSLIILTVFIWLAAAISARADDSSKYTYAFAEIKVYSGPYNGTLEATYFSQVKRIKSSQSDDFKETAKENVQNLIQGTDEKVGKGSLDVQVMQNETSTGADNKRDQDIKAIKNYPYAPGNTVKYFTVNFSEDN